MEDSCEHVFKNTNSQLSPQCQDLSSQLSGKQPGASRKNSRTGGSCLRHSRGLEGAPPPSLAQVEQKVKTVMGYNISNKNVPEQGCPQLTEPGGKGTATPSSQVTSSPKLQSAGCVSGLPFHRTSGCVPQLAVSSQTRKQAEPRDLPPAQA